MDLLCWLSDHFSTIVNTFLEAGIFWMILQDYRKARGKPELQVLPSGRLLLLLALSLGPIIAQGFVFGGPRYSWLAVVAGACGLVIVGSAIGFLYFKRELDRRRHERAQMAADYVRETERLKAELANAEQAAMGALIKEDHISIVRAKWGIGGTAFKDVAEVIRSHIANGKIKVPASIGLFGDPYVGHPKTLEVEYLVVRKWWLSIQEGQTLELPEKDGEEQSRKFLQEAREKLKKMHDPEDDLILKMTETEYNVYSQFKANFGLLPWPQKIALNKVCSIGAMSRDDLIGDLTVRGFASPEFILTELLQKGFLDLHRGMLEPPATKAKWMGVLFDKIKLC